MTSFNKEDLELFISAVNYAMKMCWISKNRRKAF
jgi:hypothetical protein